MRAQPRTVLVIAMMALPLGCKEPERIAVDPPVAAAQEFLSAVRRKDCDTAWSYLSAQSRAFIEVRSAEMVRHAPYYADRFAPRRLYCEPTSVHRFNSYDPRSARLHAQDAGRAVVSVDRHEPAGFLVPGFWSTRTDIHPAEMQMVEEGSGWKVLVEERMPERRRAGSR